MPAVKKLYQSSANNAKATSSLGHSFQALGRIARGTLGQLRCVPLASRIHEGLVFSNRDRRTLLDKFVPLLLSFTGALEGPLLWVVDADSASAKVIRPLRAAHHHVLARIKCNAVAYHPAVPPTRRRRGRPRRSGEKVRLRDLWRSGPLRASFKRRRVPSLAKVVWCCAMTRSSGCGDPSANRFALFWLTIPAGGG